MRKYLPYFLLFVFVSVFILIFFFQSEPVKFNNVTVQDKFRISIPEYLSKTASIDSSALIQYKNEKEQLFLLVYEISDTSTESLQDFFKKISDDFISKLENGSLLKYYPERINALDALVGNVRGRVNETGVYYRIAVIKSGSSFYKIIFGVSENMKSFYDEDIETILQSFNCGK